MDFNLRRLIWGKVVVTKRYMVVAVSTLAGEPRAECKFTWSNPDAIISHSPCVLESSESEHAKVEFCLKTLNDRFSLHPLVAANDLGDLNFLDEHKLGKPHRH